MIVYHGSHEIVKVPVFGRGTAANDYGRGFYCTESEELAKEWACPTIKDGFANKYELDLSGLKIMYLNQDGYNILNWIAILLNNRIFPKRLPISRQTSAYLLKEFLPDISGYDVIWGYRADDSYFTYAKDFLNNTISVNQLSQAMRLGELGDQIVLKSKKPLSKFILSAMGSLTEASIIPGAKVVKSGRSVPIWTTTAWTSISSPMTFMHWTSSEGR